MVPNRIPRLTLAALILITTAAAAQTPAPKPATPFPIPLANGTTATAFFLPAPTGSHLIYTTPTGQTVFGSVIWTTPTPPEPIPPPPPPPTLASFAIVERPTETTPAQRCLLLDPAWRDHLPTAPAFRGIIPIDILDPDTGQTPTHLLPYVTAATAQPLPALIALDTNGNPAITAPLPTTAQAILDLINQKGAQPNAATGHHVRQRPPDDRGTPCSTCTRPPPTHSRMLPQKKPLRQLLLRRPRRTTH